MKVCIFEDNASAGLKPLNLLRHTSEIICGAVTLKEKIENYLKQNFEISLHCRNHLSNYCKDKFPHTKINKLDHDDYIFLNSRVLFTQDFINGLLVIIEELKDFAITSGKNIIAIHISRNLIPKIKQKIEQRLDNNLISQSLISRLRLKQIEIEQLDKEVTDEIKTLEYPSDMILHFEDQLRRDLENLLNKKKSSLNRVTGAEFVNKREIHIASNCFISPYTVFDASKGKIYIEDNTHIEPFSYLAGPLYIGEHTTVRSGTKLYGPVRIGNHCKVSGEISSSILHSFVNKQHLGFLGHSYICEWVNLGAGTTTSNLKNNYSKISLKLDGKSVDSGSIFLGSIIGDHTKTGINSMLNTGTIIGISSNLFGSGYHAKTVKSFSWIDAQSGKIEKYDIEKAISTARISMSRRNVKMTQSYETLLRFLFKSPSI